MEEAAQAGLADLTLFLNTVWDFICMRFEIYGYTFSYGAVGFFGVIFSWGMWAFVRWMDT